VLSPTHTDHSLGSVERGAPRPFSPLPLGDLTPSPRGLFQKDRPRPECILSLPSYPSKSTWPPYLLFFPAPLNSRNFTPDWGGPPVFYFRPLKLMQAFRQTSSRFATSQADDSSNYYNRTHEICSQFVLDLSGIYPFFFFQPLVTVSSCSLDHGRPYERKKPEVKRFVKATFPFITPFNSISGAYTPLESREAMTPASAFALPLFERGAVGPCKGPAPV